MKANILTACKSAIEMYKTGKRLLQFSWEMDKATTLLFYLTGIIGAIIPILIAFLYQYLIDELVVVEQEGLQVIPIAVISLLGLRYLLRIFEDFLLWSYNRGYLDYLLRYKLQNKINIEFSKKVLSLDIPHIEDPVTQDKVMKARDSMMWRLPDFMRTLLYFVERGSSIIASFIVLVTFGWWLPVVIAAISLPRLYLRAKLGNIQWSIYGAGVPESKKLWYLNWILSQPNVIRESKIFRSQEKLIERYKSLQQILFLRQKKVLDSVVKVFTLPTIVETVIIFIIASMYLPSLTQGLITIGSFTLLLSVIERYNDAVGGITSRLGELYENKFFVGQYFEVMDLEPLLKKAESPKDLGELKPPTIEFCDVTFTYPNEKSPALQNVSLKVNPGESIAFVGANGAGKSTIIKLLCRFYDVDSGSILINGINIKDINLDQWYQFIGTLFQEFEQYHFSIRENITMGMEYGKSDERMIEAAKKSGAAEFIERLHNGYEQTLGKEYEDGTELSTGQWQKLAIARAFYEEAPVLILDEPTSAVDATAEYEIFQNLHTTYGDKSLIFVSHRFSTVRNADRIFVVEEGRITESGTHEELLNLQGRYARMFTLQAKGYK
jgi:ABC-type multidrug transport system fused ATPase/permease subunit